LVNDATNELVSYDIIANTFTTIGAMGNDGDFGDLSWGPGGALYALGGRDDDNLYTVNTGNGNAALVGSHGVIDLFGLGYNYSNSTMYATQFSRGSGYYSMNTNNGSANLIVDNGIGIGGITYVPSIGLVGVEDGAGDFYRLDPDGTYTLLHDGDFINDSDIAYDPVRNVIWAADWSNNLYMYDLNNNFARTLVATTNFPMDGVVYGSPIPEPSAAVALLALAVLPLVRRRR
jgi:MYXO-CTERM domain-containing protein